MSKMKELQIMLDNLEEARLQKLRIIEQAIEIAKISMPHFKLRCPQCFSVVWLCTYCCEFVCIKCSCHNGKNEFAKEIWPDKENNDVKIH